MTQTEHRLQPWWKPITLSTGTCWRYAIGSLCIYLYRDSDEWQLAWEYFPDREEYYQVTSDKIDSIPDVLKVSRYVFKTAPPAFCLKPRLLDRPVVVRTRQKVHIPPGESVVFYISSPVCVSVELTQPDRVLTEIPALRLSDTWFGPSTRIGELCYATKTHARNSRDDLPSRPHRAVTPVTIHNKSSALLSIDKLSIPVPFLGIYGLANGTLWTDPISLEHTDNHPLATLVINKTPPDESNPIRLAEPRFPSQRASLVRAFTTIFSG